MIFVTYDFYLVISLLQSTLYKTETFGDGTKCLSYRQMKQVKKGGAWPTLGVCFTEVFILQGVRQERVDYWWFSLSCNQNLTWKPFNTESLWIIQKTLPRIRSVQYFICEIFGKTFYPNLYSFVPSCHACLCPFQGYKYNRWKPTETSVFKFSY